MAIEKDIPLFSFSEDTAVDLKQIIFLSTVSVYGGISNNMTPDEDMPANPEDYYGESKLAAEKEIREFSEKYHIPYTIFRLVPVYPIFTTLEA